MDNATTGANDPTTAGDSGNGFLLEQGYTVVSAGWDATVQAGNGGLTITVPVARNADGTTIAGPALEELVVDDTTTMTMPLTYAANSADKSQANLTVRVRYEDPPTPVPADGWAFADDTLRSVRLEPSGPSFHEEGPDELTATAPDPLVGGGGVSQV